LSERLAKLAVGAFLSATTLLAQASESPLARLKVDGKKIGWDGVELGMSVVQAERRIGTTLALTPTGRKCGGFVVDVERGTLRLTLGFPGAKPGAKIDSLYVHFEGYQVLADRDALVAELKRAAPEAVYLPPPAHPEIAESESPAPAYLVGPGQDAVAVLEPGSGLRLTTRACFG
jgi:hypothetical protein